MSMLLTLIVGALLILHVEKYRSRREMLSSIMSLLIKPGHDIGKAYKSIKWLECVILERMHKKSEHDQIREILPKMYLFQEDYIKCLSSEDTSINVRNEQILKRVQDVYGIDLLNTHPRLMDRVLTYVECLIYRNRREMYTAYDVSNQTRDNGMTVTQVNFDLIKIEMMQDDKCSSLLLTTSGRLISSTTKLTVREEVQTMKIKDTILDDKDTIPRLAYIEGTLIKNLGNSLSVREMQLGLRDFLDTARSLVSFARENNIRITQSSVRQIYVYHMPLLTEKLQNLTQIDNEDEIDRMCEFLLESRQLLDTYYDEQIKMLVKRAQQHLDQIQIMASNNCMEGELQ